MRKFLTPLSILLLIGLDQWVKYYTVSHIKLGESHSFIPNILSLTYLRNYGAAFSILQNQQVFFILITVVIIGGAIWYLLKHFQGDRWLIIALTLIISGGLGNFIDRLRLGYVIDMFQTEFIEFAVFNVADSCLTIGVILLFIYLVKEEKNGINR